MQAQRNWSTLIVPDLRGQRVMITGASGGLGRGLAVAFASQGCAVALHYNSDVDSASATLDQISAIGPGHVLVQGDLSRPGEAQRVVSDCVEGLGGLDLLINNAGHMGGRTLAADITEGDFDNVMNLNARATIVASAAAIPHLRKTRGNIINMSSIAARRGGGPGAMLYAASKGMIATVTKSLATELAKDGIRVNAVAPGLVETAFHDFTSEQLAQIGSNIPLGRVATVDDCLGAALFLASDMLSGYLTGQSIEVNGGALMP